MGQTGLFAENARLMNIDLSTVDIAVLSHGHYDHGGGLKTFLSLNNCNAKERKHNMGSFGLNQIQDGVLIPDDFQHEQYLLIEEGGKKVLLSGCSTLSLRRKGF